MGLEQFQPSEKTSNQLDINTLSLKSKSLMEDILATNIHLEAKIETRLETASARPIDDEDTFTERELMWSDEKTMQGFNTKHSQYAADLENTLGSIANKDKD
jgi:hypothetical protein